MILLQAGADPNRSNAAGHSPLRQALMASSPSTALVEALLDFSCDDPRTSAAADAHAMEATRRFMELWGDPVWQKATDEAQKLKLLGQRFTMAELRSMGFSLFDGKAAGFTLGEF